MSSPARSVVPEAPVPPVAGPAVPGARGLFVLGCLSIAWTVLFPLLSMGLAGLHLDRGATAGIDAGTSLLRFVLDAAFLALVLVFARGQGTGAVARLALAAGVLSGVSVAIDLVYLLGLGGVDLLRSSGRALGIVTWWVYVVTAALFWAAIALRAKGTSVAYSIAFAVLVASSIAVWAAPMLLSYDTWYDLVLSPTGGPALGFTRVALSVARQGLALVVLRRLTTRR